MSEEECERREGKVDEQCYVVECVRGENHQLGLQNATTHTNCIM